MIRMTCAILIVISLFAIDCFGRNDKPASSSSESKRTVLNSEYISPYVIYEAFAEAGRDDCSGVTALVETFPDLVNVRQELENRGDERNRTLLHVAAEKGHVELARLLIAKGADVNAEDVRETPIRLAVINGHKAMVKLLIDNGADIADINDREREGLWCRTTTDTAGATPLEKAVYLEDYETVRNLLEAGAKIEVHEDSALMGAAYKGNEKMVRLFLNHGADVNFVNDYGESPLSRGLTHLGVVKMLVEKGADVNFRDKDRGDSVLERALDNGDLPVVKVLMEKGAKLDDPFFEAIIRDDRTGVEAMLKKDPKKARSSLWPEWENRLDALHVAAIMGRTQIIVMLLKNGVSAKSESGALAVGLAARCGHKDTVEYLISQGGPVDGETKGIGWKKLSLHQAIENGHFDVFKLLMEKGADPHITDGNCRNALATAAGFNRMEMVKALLARDKTLSNARLFQDSPVGFALQNGHEDMARFLIAGGHCPGRFLYGLIAAGQPELARLLIEKGANVNDDTGYVAKYTPLQAAAAAGDVATVKLLIEKGADVKFKNEHEGTALHEAVKGRCTDSLDEYKTHIAEPAAQLEIAKLLLKHGAEVNVANKYGSTPLSAAVTGGNLALVKFLLANGASVAYAEEQYKASLFHAAAYDGDREMIDCLVKAGASPKKKDKRGRTALYEALKNRSLRTARLLALNGVGFDAPMLNAVALCDCAAVKAIAAKDPKQLNVVEGRGDVTPLLLTVMLNDDYMAALLLKLGAKADQAIWKSGITPLMMAIGFERYRVAEALLKAGADPNKLDQSRDTALMDAMGRGKLPAVKLLLKYGADIKTKSLDGDNKTLMYWAGEHGDKELIDFLVKKGLDVNISTRDGSTGLHEAAWYNNPEAARALIAHGAKVNVTNASGNTPLHYAAEHNWMEVVEILVKNGADVNARNKKGETPLHLATSGLYNSGRVSPKVTRYLLDNGADREIKDNKGKRPIDRLMRHHSKAVLKLLRDYQPKKIDKPSGN